MTRSEIQGWLTYWTNANMVSVDAIKAFDQVALARRFCSCMRSGVFSEITDLQIWRALTAMRDEEMLEDFNYVGSRHHY